MATTTTDLDAAYEFLRQAKVRECYLPTPEAPAAIQDEGQLDGLIAYLGPAACAAEVQAYVTGRDSLDGVMLLSEETEFDADLRVALAANTEEALRDLLLAFPTDRVGFFYIAGAWALDIVPEVLDGTVLPAREGYYAAEQTFLRHSQPPSRPLAAGDYELVRSHWDQATWDEVMALGYRVHACHVVGELQALCFHWEVAPWRNEVHGLQAVSDPECARSVVSSATEEVLAQGKVATCTANLASEIDYLDAFRAVGYQPFYRVHSFRGRT